MLILVPLTIVVAIVNFANGDRGPLFYFQERIGKDGEKFKIYKAKILNDNIEGNVGEIIRADKSGLILQCINGQLSLLEVQKQGKKRMDYISFINGNQNFKGTILK